MNVQTAPRVTLPGGALATAQARGDVTLRCEARGRPPPAVAWLKDGEPLSPNSRDIALLDGTSLRIQGVLRVDAGMFQCAANSIAGSAVAALRLVVLAPGNDSNKSRTSQKTNLPPPKVPFSNATHDIFNSLVSSGSPDPILDPTPEDLDFLGETSSAYTSIPDVEYDDAYDSDGDNSFHAAEGLDLDELGQGNASVVSAPKGLKAVIVKHRFVTLSWEEPEHKAEDITGYAVVYKVKGSERERIARGNPQRHEMNVASLQPNTTYQFSVIAFTQHSHSPATEIIEATTAEEELTYGPPQDVRVEALGPHSIRVWWSPPTQTQNGLASTAPPTRYAVYYTDEETGREQVQWAEGVVASVGGLRAGSAYRVRVAAAGGAPAPALRVRTPHDAPAAPPVNVTATPSGATVTVPAPARAHAASRPAAPPVNVTATPSGATVTVPAPARAHAASRPAAPPVNVTATPSGATVTVPAPARAHAARRTRRAARQRHRHAQWRNGNCTRTCTCARRITPRRAARQRHRHAQWRNGNCTRTCTCARRITPRRAARQRHRHAQRRHGNCTRTCTCARRITPRRAARQRHRHAQWRNGNCTRTCTCARRITPRRAARQRHRHAQWRNGNCTRTCTCARRITPRRAARQRHRHAQWRNGNCTRTCTCARRITPRRTARQRHRHAQWRNGNCTRTCTCARRTTHPPRRPSTSPPRPVAQR
ncbi:unnamed protein product [Parnassius mnemosyne]|uniref:Hemolin n=1 Tax=Parnassius mnemosyne TaxID=213953 RepID=A0AAV1LE26_9NEOP